MIFWPKKILILALRRISYEARVLAFFPTQREIHADHSYVARVLALPSQDLALCRSDFFEIPTERTFFQNSLLRSARFSKRHTIKSFRNYQMPGNGIPRPRAL